METSLMKTGSLYEFDDDSMHVDIRLLEDLIRRGDTD